MPIKIITKNAEKTLLDYLDNDQETLLEQHVFQCRFAKLSISAPNTTEFISQLKHILNDRESTILYLQDGDLFIHWHGMKNNVVQSIEDIIYQYCTQQKCDILPDDFVRYYSCHANEKKLRNECNKRIDPNHKSTEEQAPSNIFVPSIKPEFSTKQLSSFIKTFPSRKKRKVPTILIVEDQAFSRKIMLTLLGRTYNCTVAKNAEEAIEKYGLFAPDITFLDIELPDLDGHSLAKLFKQTDPESYIVMITANNFATDVQTARENNVQGFVVKPYNKQKILQSISNYFKLHGSGG